MWDWVLRKIYLLIWDMDIEYMIEVINELLRINLEASYYEFDGGALSRKSKDGANTTIFWIMKIRKK